MTAPFDLDWRLELHDPAGLTQAYEDQQRQEKGLLPRPTLGVFPARQDRPPGLHSSSPGRATTS